MKSLKVILVLLITSLIFSGTFVVASSHAFIGITLPAFAGKYSSPDKIKRDSTIQKVKKTSATSNLTGGEVAVEGRIGLKTGSSSYLYSDWKTLPKGNWVNIPNTGQSGTFRLQLKTAESFINKSTFYGNWWYEYTS